ncbi:MAG: SURF1 family protein [Porticoccaceae bacterium]|jgi:surfeit locus 1 family protein
MTSDPQAKADKFSWQPNAKILLFTLLMFPLLVALGYWQLDRAQEKRQILAEFVSNQQAAPAQITDLNSAENLQYRPAVLTGKLDAKRRLLLDNRVRDGRPGYEVFELLTIDDSAQKILVNRGWVAASLDRRVWPQVDDIGDEVTLRGSLYAVLKGGYQLDDGIGRVSEWPARVGWVSVARAEQLFNESLYPYQLRLDSDSPAALETGWPTVAVQPEKHTAYAVQWFVMAVVLVLMTVVANSNLSLWLKQKKGFRHE